MAETKERHCCYCCLLKRGVFIVACFCLAATILVLITETIGYYNRQTKERNLIMILRVLPASLTAISSVCLIIGIYRNESIYLLPFLVSTFFGLVLFLITVIIDTTHMAGKYHHTNDKLVLTKELIIAWLSVVVFWSVGIYWWCVVHRYYNVLIRENRIVI